MISNRENTTTIRSDILDAIVIGAGPSGLSAGYQLKKCNLSYVIVEAADGVLTSYRYLWDNFKIAQSINEISVDGLDLSKKFSNNYQLKRDELIGAYEDFVVKHQLKIQFFTKVFSISKTKDNLFEIKTNGSCYQARNVIMALSMNAKFRFPAFISTQTLNQYNQIMMHSAWYQGVNSLRVPKGANILVVGSGLYALTVTKELKEGGYKVSIACGYNDKQIAENNQHLHSIPVKLTDLTKLGISNFGRLTGIQAGHKLLFDDKHDPVKITDYNKIIFATGYSYSPDLICQLLAGCATDVKEKVLNHVNGVIPNVPGVYLVGMPVKGRNTTTFAEGDKFAINIAKTIAKENIEQKVECSNKQKTAPLTLAYTGTLFNESVTTQRADTLNAAPPEFLMGAAKFLVEFGKFAQAQNKIEQVKSIAKHNNS